MDVIKIDLSSNEWPEEILKTKMAIEQGKVVVFPSDTVYGLAANALDETAVKKLFAIKKRPITKPISIIVKDILMAKKLAFINDHIENFLKKLWPGPITAVVEKKSILSDSLTANTNTIGLRMPNFPFIISLMKELNCPITATSANFSNDAPISDSKIVIDTFEKSKVKPDLVLDAGLLPDSLPSTVIDFTKSRPQILRVGPVTKEMLMNILGELS